VAECLSALGFDDMEAAAWLLLSPQLGEILEVLRKLLKTQGAGHSLHNVRHLVGVWLCGSAVQYATVLGQRLLHNATQGEPPVALGNTCASPPTRQHRAGRTPSLATSWGRLSSRITYGLDGTTPGYGAGSLFGPPAVAGGLSTDNNNFSSNPTALGAEGAGQRAGFCSTAPTDASQGASSAVHSASQHVGAEFSASLPAVAGGLSSINNIHSNPTALVAEGAEQRAGFCGTAPTDAPPGASFPTRSAFQHTGAESRAQLPAVAGGLSSTNLTSSLTSMHLHQLVRMLRDLPRAQASVARIPVVSSFRHPPLPRPSRLLPSRWRTSTARPLLTLLLPSGASSSSCSGQVPASHKYSDRETGRLRPAPLACFHKRAFSLTRLLQFRRQLGS
jgi:hypothetical protein